MLSLIKDCLWEPLPIVLIMLGYALYAFLTSTFDYWLVRGVPYRKPTPLLGNFGDLLLFRKSQPEGISEMYNWFGNERFFGVFRVRSPILIVRDPELIKCVCVKDFHVFCNRGIPVNSTKDPLSGHLFNLEGKHWKSLRSKLTPAFSSGKLKNMFYLLVECSDDLTRLVERRLEMLENSSSSSSSSFPDASIVEVRELAANFTIDVIGSCAFGIQINALSDEDSEFRKAARRLSKPSYKATLWRMLRTSMPKLYKLLGVQVIDPSVTKFFMDVVSQMVKERENKALKRHDFMDLLIELKNRGTLELDNGNGLRAHNDEEVPVAEEIVLDENTIAAQAFVFFVAGYETSSNTIAFCLYELAVNPEIQEKARRDIIDALDKRDSKLTYDAVQDMKYLDMVILETLRKYPPAPLLSRRCEYPYKLPGSDVELSKGMRVVIPIYAIHHDPKHYPEPDKFRPERFGDEEKRARHPYTFLPFGEGPRNCIGTRFALLQTKVGVITFLRKYQVEVCEKTDIPIKFSRRSLVTASETGVSLNISRLSE
ncbi:probable cytochrome P450 6a13 [Nasonia vitripennis]|uniref:Cytochrome P450 n=1 Tax=Nasonia vitripennis TaxID=7425 RepID=A0A7M7QRA2_NASVI|nr:probable cytochrome P450 6a13 [Nasonia vitripennis]XP_008208821.1 probable cytochrome P450 6a13 [Nasonia vitripennis]XP_032451621.1 probable cytochrome P450 6a13 [Nasonia vitripennis]XP_032451622.1 probable cytochrome P450 6a13 [Nasonia vitripennis]XP_032451623.1 probable cytochrome P450 6a13 [Nasonia vitripennis]